MAYRGKKLIVVAAHYDCALGVLPKLSLNIMECPNDLLTVFRIQAVLVRDLKSDDKDVSLALNGKTLVRHVST
jgi:hypothetical protein